MEIDAQAEAKPRKVDEGVDSCRNTLGENSAITGGSAGSASTETTSSEGTKEALERRFFKDWLPNRRFTHCPEKKTICTSMESYPRRMSSHSKPYFKRRRCLKIKLSTIFEYHVVTDDNRVRFPRGRLSSFRGNTFHSRSRLPRSVEEVDQLMMNLDIHQEPPVSCPTPS